MTVKLVGSTSGSVSLQAPASTTGGAHRVLTLPDVNGTIATTTTAGKFASYAIICDQKSSSTNGGTFTQDAWQTRDLNTEIVDADGIVSISSNQFTLQAGTYLIKASAPGYYVYDHMAKLYDVTASADVALGTSEYTSAQAQTRSFITARVTISGATTYEIRHKSGATKSSNGFGESTNIDVEKYLIVEIYKES